MKMLYRVVLLFLMIIYGCNGASTINNSGVPMENEISIMSHKYYEFRISTDRDYSKVEILNLETNRKDVIHIESSFYEYFSEDLNRDGINDLVLKLSEDSECIVIVLLGKSSYSIPQLCNSNIRDIQSVLYKDDKLYGTYRPHNKHGDLWTSELIDFTKDTFDVLYEAYINFEKIDKKIELIVDRKDTVKVHLTNQEANRITRFELDYLWNEVLLPRIEK